MRTLGVLGVVWAVGLLIVPIAGIAADGWVAWGFLALTFAIIAIGGYLHGTVQAPLVADLADHSLIGRYMAASAFSWGVGFAVGPAIGGVVLGQSPHLLWPAARGVPRGWSRSSGAGTLDPGRRPHDAETRAPALAES